MTLAMVKTDNICSIGIALMSPKEKNYIKKRGFAIASGRAVKNPAVQFNSAIVEREGGAVPMLFKIAEIIRERLKLKPNTDVSIVMSEVQRSILGKGA
jgi:hypothetical protein